MGLGFPAYTKGQERQDYPGGAALLPFSTLGLDIRAEQSRGWTVAQLVKCPLNKREDPSSTPAVLLYTLHPSAGEPETLKAQDSLTSLAHVTKTNIYSTRGMTPGIYL